ncbi:MAG TPA: cupin domain-containing protein [Pseudolabrys sp.]|nr:cupin domain-containing protein [Pseudolabrys sp.]
MLAHRGLREAHLARGSRKAAGLNHPIEDLHANNSIHGSHATYSDPEKILLRQNGFSNERYQGTSETAVLCWSMRFAMAERAFTPAAAGKSHLVLGSIVCTTLLGGAETDGNISLIEVCCPQGMGPSPHVDPWRETFYVMEGEIEFLLEGGGTLQPLKVASGDVVSIPAGLGHAFHAVSQNQARILIISAPAGLEAFFAEAGEPLFARTPPTAPRPFDRARFEAATDRYGIRAFR